MENKNKKFWMVLREGGTAPTMRHETLQNAEEEAKRLTTKHGDAFYVLEAVVSIERSKEIIQETLGK
jgi:hypothetical protein